MTLKGLGEMSEGYSAETCAGKILLDLRGAEQRVVHARTRERGPHSVLVEFFWSFFFSWVPPCLNPRRDCHRMLNLWAQNPKLGVIFVARLFACVLGINFFPHPLLKTQ